MEILGVDFGSIYTGIIAIIMAVYNSITFVLIKLFLGVYAVVLLVDILLLLVQRYKSGAIAGDFRDTVIGMDVPAEITTNRKKLRRQWAVIRQKLETDKESDWKVAIIEADKIIDEILKGMGYKGENLSERLENIVPGQIEKLEEMKEAHAYRNKVIHDDSLSLTQEKAKEIVAIYEELLIMFEVLE